MKPVGCKLSNSNLMAPWIAIKLGDREEYGIDYDETFPSVANMTLVRIIPALAASHTWPLFQMHVKNTFLHMVT